MAATPVVHSPTSSTDQASSTKTIARARRDETDYAPIINVEGRWRIAPAYYSLPSHKAQYALEAYAQGIPESGKRLANCLLCGAVFAHTKFNRKLALAHKFPCGELCCENCGKGIYRLRKWMARRDPARIYALRLAGMEITIPRTLDWLADRARLHEIARRILLWLGIKEAAIFDTALGAVRIVARCDGFQDCPAIRSKVRTLGGPRATPMVGFNHPEGVTNSHAKHLMSWAMAGMECLPLWPVGEQVTFRKLTAGVPLIRTLGSHFRCLTDEEVKIRHEAEQRQLLESMERKGWIMEYIPHNERVVQTCDDIEDGYERVEYHVEFEETYVYPHTHATVADRASP